MKKILFLGLLSVTALLCDAQQADTLQRIDSLFKYRSAAAPGGVLTIVRNGTTIYNKAFGLSNLEFEIKSTPETIFEAGSVSKQFTATAVLLLIQDGKLSPDDDIRKYLPEIPMYNAPITIRHLLTHTSGLKDWGQVAALGGWPRGTRVYTQAHALAIIRRQTTLNFEPGTQYSYSNSNFTVLTALVEKLSGMSLARFTRERMFDKIGMTNTRWRDDFKQVVGNRAQAYSKSHGAYELDMPFEHTHGHAALLTTTADLQKWNQYWAEGKFGQQVTDLRTARGVLKNGRMIEYACGAVYVSRYNGLTEICHSGATAGYRSWLAWYPEKGLSVSFLCNDGNVAPVTIGHAVAAILFGAPTTTANMRDTLAKGHIKLSFTSHTGLPLQTTADTLLAQKRYAGEKLSAYTGTYHSEECDASLQVVLTDNALQLFRDPATYERLMPLYIDGKLTAFYTKDHTLVEFIKDKQGKVTGFYAGVARASNIIFTRK